MTDLRPEREGRSYGPSRDADGTYDREAFEAAVGQLADPLMDPLPGRPPAAQPRPDVGRNAQNSGPGPDRPRTGPDAAPSPPRSASAGSGSPWFRPRQAATQPQATAPEPQPSAQAPAQAQSPAEVQPQAPAVVQPSAYEAPARTYEDPAHPYEDPARPYVEQVGPYVGQAGPYDGQAGPYMEQAGPDVDHPRQPGPYAPISDAETMALRQAEEDGDRGETDVVSRETDASPVTPPVTGGRAARRKAAQEAAKRGNRGARRGSSAAAATASSSGAEASSAPMSRLEARRAERARKESPGVIASRAVGEVFITLGVLMLLFVTYQLWWTNVRAQQQAGGTASSLEHEWDEGGEDRKPDAFTPGQGFAIMYIPKLDVKVPIAEGISKPAVLDRGMVGHYDKNSVKTAMPWDKQGNFAVAGHRNTHGEPFRYINRLTKGDKIVVETRSTYYTYAMESILPQTSPRNIGVIGPVPKGSGFTGPGRYLTLTTCTPEFTSTYRMIVWGKMVEERPRSKGKPDALVS
ncbi:peptidase C60 family protein [Streptomyces griseoflavus]|uniref:class E sortase n=1 Tax=Streptomyces rimosus TaxID=1927 RepID=UPI0004C5800A|nr:class E sortase [Streptomyces rimosus]KOG64718.1 peptidase C60 family protein [Streptomyces griseoflavus]